jgi:hypothetical protein
LPSFKSPPHCEQVFAVAGLRVPQNPQWMSAPAFAASTEFSSVTIFSSAARWNLTLSGWGAPQFWQVFFEPLFLPSQLGHTHSSSTNPLLSFLSIFYSLILHECITILQ